MKPHYTIFYLLFLMITALYSKYMIVKTKGKGKKQDPNLFGPKESLGSEEQRMHSPEVELTEIFCIKYF